MEMVDGETLAKTTPEERKAMDALVEAKTVDSFDSTDFPDEYRGRLEQLITHYLRRSGQRRRCVYVAGFAEGVGAGGQGVQTCRELGFIHRGIGTGIYDNY